MQAWIGTTMLPIVLRTSVHTRWVSTNQTHFSPPKSQAGSQWCRFAVLVQVLVPDLVLTSGTPSETVSWCQLLLKTLVSRPLDSFLQRCKASLIMALAMHGKPSGAFALPVCWRSCQLATMAFSTCKDSGLALTLSMSLLSSNFATPSTILGKDKLAHSKEALSHGKVVVVSLKSR